MDSKYGGESSTDGEAEQPLLGNGMGGSVELKRARQRSCLLLITTLAFLAAAAALAALYAQQIMKGSEDKTCASADCVQAAAAIAAAMDTTADPCDDFFQYSCGGWNVKHDIPAGSSTVSQFSTLSDTNELTTKAALTTSTDPATVKVRGLFSACQDETTRDAASLNTFVDDVVTPAITTPTSLEAKLASLQKLNVAPLFGLYVSADDMNSTRNVVRLVQGGLGLPDPNYYINATVGSDPILTAYAEYIQQGLTWMNYPGDLPTIAANIVEFEKMLANYTWTVEQLRDSVAVYNPMNVSDLQLMCPYINWTLFFEVAFASQTGGVVPQPIVVNVPTFFGNLSDVLQTLEADTLDAYLHWMALSPYADDADETMVSNYWNFQATLRGITAPASLWRQCVRVANSVMGYELGRIYVQASYSNASLFETQDMVNMLVEAFRDRLQNIDWMDADSRDAALVKLDMIMEQIGFPVFILNDTALGIYYQAVNISTVHLGNVLSALAASVDRNWALALKPVDRAQWYMTPSTVNAYYDPSTNQIVFPAGILQYPFFAANQLRALNYGGIGVVIGHEISHGFDDQGRLFNGYGDLKPWWSNETVEEFLDRAQCFVDQYDNYTVNGMSVNGQLTLGENIADNGGIWTAFAAYQNWVKQNGKESLLPSLALTPNQLFFVSFAQVWCNDMTSQARLERLLTDPHSPGQYRVIGTVTNSADWYQAFKCPMPSNRTMCRLW